MLRTAWRCILDTFAPNRCAGCDEVSPLALCAGCATRLTEATPPPARIHAHGLAVAAFEFRDPARSVLHRGKYRGNRDALGALAALAAPRLRAQIAAPHAVVAVPLGARRLRQRGYNQAELTARSVAAVLGAPVLGGLVRLRDTPPQAGRDETERRRNVAGAFAWTGVALDDRHLWLVDDVLTTGATTAAVAAALVAAGARRVDVATLAAVV